MSILIENVSKKFNGKIVLDSINLEIKTGSLVALLGGSGSGKSSLLRIVAGFEHPDTGRVWLHGKNSRKISVQEKEIGFVFQAYALFQHLTVYENIAFGTSVNKKNFLNNPKNSMLFSFGERQPLSSRSTEKLGLKPRIGSLFNQNSRLLSIKDNVLHSVTFFLNTQKQVRNTIISFLGQRSIKVNSLSNSINKALVNQSIYQPKEVPFKKPEIFWRGPSTLVEKESKNTFSHSSWTKDTCKITKGKFNKLSHSVEELLRVVELEELAHRYPAQLSGGQCQRVALARALAVEPKVLLLDEPFGALDQKVRKQLRRWLRQLHEKVGVTTIFVTHDYQEAMEVANEIVVLEEGRVKYSLQPPKSFYQKINKQ